jgi:hypothetical protein
MTTEPPRRVDLSQDSYEEGMATILREIHESLTVGDTVAVYIQHIRKGGEISES